MPWRPCVARGAAVLFLLVMSMGTAMAEQRLLVGTTGDYEPITWYDKTSGHYVGQAITLVEDLAAAEGYAVTYVPTTWPGMMSDLLAGKFQMAAGGITKTKERARLALLSDPVAATGKVALVRCADKDTYGSLDAIDRAGTRVVENRGGTNQLFALTATHKAVVVLVPDNAMAFEYLEQGKADVMFTDAIEAVYHQAHDKGLCAINPDKPFTHSERVFLFRKDEAALRDSFNRWLATRKGGGAQ